MTYLDLFCAVPCKTMMMWRSESGAVTKWALLLFFSSMMAMGVALQVPPQGVGRREALGGALALGGLGLLTPLPSRAVVFLDPARYGDQELKNAAIAKCRTRVREAIVKEPTFASRFFLLALLDGLSFEEKTGRGGPDATVAASIQLPGPEYAELREALGVLTESQKALKRTNALTLADLVALAGAEAVAAVGGPEISVQLGRTDADDLNDKVKAVRAGGKKAASQYDCAPAIDLEKRDDPKIVLAAFGKAGFTEREATALLGTLAVLDNAATLASSASASSSTTTTEQDRGAAKQRGKIGRYSDGGAEKKPKAAQPLFDLYGTADGDEDAIVDKMDGDIDDFYIADAFGSRKEAYGRRVGSSASAAGTSGGAISEATFNQYFAVLQEDNEPATWVDNALLADSQTKVWVNKYSTERLTYLKDLAKTFYRITEVGAEYTGGKYAALLDNRAPKKLS